ncbi:MFS transporter [Armatimonas sp.]|uniref:MFS transporter n=1 Tax=Armatimonas sp. TaxID=1872638 RepID=UPI00286D261C|nr:MFS transporter [Armatimonas sp.]
MSLRWVLVGMLFLASVLNYVDRQTLAILAPTIQKDLGMTDPQYAAVNNFFLVAYTISYLVSGRLTDKLGPRKALALYISFWSVANMLTGLARSMASLSAFRFLLGLGEAGNWTTAPKLVSEWFVAKERGLAIGIYTLGATIGATIAPPLILWLASTGHWQNAFFATGAAGLLWLIPWLLVYRNAPPLAPAAPLPPAERGQGGQVAWQVVLALLLARLLTDPLWYFIQSWLAKYLVAERGLTQQQVSITWLVFLAADFGALGGGWLSGVLIKRGMPVVAGRLRVMLFCACLTPLTALIALSPTVNGALVFAMIVTLAHMAWMINGTTLVTDLIPKDKLATVFGLVAAGSTLGGLLMNSLVGNTVGAFGYRPTFFALSGLHLCAFALLSVALKKK